MNHRRSFALGAAALALALPLVGCGDYADPKPATTGGGAGQGGSTAAGTGGTGGEAASTTSGGMAGTTQAGTGGTAGTEAAGAGGTAGTGAAGAGGDSAGTAGMAGTAGTDASGGMAGTAGTGGAPQEIECPDPVPDATPCGGDVSGTWTVASCTLAITGEIDMTGFGLGCTTASITSGSLEVTGTITFADGMFTDNTVTTGEQVIELPHECLNVSGTVTGCDRVGGPVQGSLGYATFDCVDNTTTMGCTCSATIDQLGGYGILTFDPLAEGEYMTMGTSLLLETDDRDVKSEHAYCVNGDTMTTTFATAPRIGTIAGPLVLKK